ncbi:MAG TPA: hypothetical protein VGK73_27865 [Polyangiaceae bacterium]
MNHRTPFEATILEVFTAPAPTLPRLRRRLAELDAARPALVARTRELRRRLSEHAANLSVPPTPSRGAR